MPKSSKEYEELGKLLENLYESGRPSKRALYRISFLKGMASGFGGVLGATILIALLVWLLTLSSRVPLLGPFADRVKNTVDTTKDLNSN